jgi:hypothetical protein
MTPKPVGAITNKNTVQQTDIKYYTGRFIMYSGITKNYMKTVGHIFTKPVQTEGTTRNFFPQKFVFHRSSHFCR